MKIPAFFVTTISLSIADRLRVLWHGTIIYRGEIEPDPGEFEVNGKVQVPPVFKSRVSRIGYEEGYGEQTKR